MEPETQSSLKNEAPPVNRELEKELLIWRTVSRPFKRRNREFYVTIIAIASLFGLVLFFVGDWIPIILVISLVFLFYVMSSVEPEEIEYKITTKGIKLQGSRMEWEQMGRFWFTTRYSNDLLIIESNTLTGRLEYVIKPEIKEQIRNILSKYLVFEEIPASYIDKASNWLTKRIPGNN